MDWVVAVLAFAGALAGSGGAAWVALRGQRQQGRGEWRQRLDEAIALVTADDPAKQQIGDELLADLIGSDLGSDDDRDLARRIARIRLGDELSHRERGDGEEVDLTGPPGDNGEVDQEEAP
ncbi:hypothetical protein [Phycicoccus flavus]|uniref:Uncharacterized protein n=1 Tax=Phycicoccus flavus TaxID=2502783 RepID=A0A8T6R2X3_9MICO|nr:hypothetical protein [Phycicoccus flavus]NHA68799.1 hypothetical protein [Phycicoccus flavus]